MITALVSIANILLIYFLVRRVFQSYKGSPLSGIYYYAAALKLVAGVLLGVLYIHHYQLGDTIQYFHDARIMAWVAYRSPLEYIDLIFTNTLDPDIWEEFTLSSQPRAFFTAKVLSVFNILTFNSYWMSSLYFSLFSFLGLWYLADKISTYFPGTKTAAAVAFLFFPSMVLWSSGIIKESIAIGALGFISGIVLETIHYKRIRYRVLWLIPLLVVMFSVKYYYAVALIPVLAGVLITALVFRNSGSLLKLASFTGVFLILVIPASFLHPNLNPDRVLDVIVSNHDAFVLKSEAGNIVNYSDLSPRISDVIRNTPRALFAGLFRPLAFEGGTLLKIFTGIENLVLLLFALAAIYNLKKHRSGDENLLLFGSLVYICIMAVFLSLSTPNLGTLARYKVGFMPLFLFLVMNNNPILTYILKQLNLDG